MFRLVACLALFVLCISPFAERVEADDSQGLGILKAKIRFGKPGQGDSLTVKGRFEPGIDPGPGAGISFRVGPVTVLSETAPDSRPKIVTVRKRTRERPDSVKLKVDVEKGKFCLKARRVDLDALRSAGPEDVTFTLEIDGAVFAGTITMGEKDGRWRFRYVPGSGGWPPGIPGINPGGGGGGGGTGGGGGPVTLRILGQGSFPWRTTFQTTVVRTQTDYYTEWFNRFPPPPPGMGMPVMMPPKVNWSTEMVVIIDLGMRPTGGYGVNLIRATALGTGLKIEWVENRSGQNCIVTQAVTYPFVFAAVSRRDGAVSFSGSVKTINCR
jgi:hypothetical protein